MRSSRHGGEWLREDSDSRRHKPKWNSYHLWNEMLKRNDRKEDLQNALGITARYAGVVLGLIAILSIPSAKNTPSGRTIQPVEAWEKYLPASSEKVATILSATNIVK